MWALVMHMLGNGCTSRFIDGGREIACRDALVDMHNICNSILLVDIVVMFFPSSVMMA